MQSERKAVPSGRRGVSYASVVVHTPLDVDVGICGRNSVKNNALSNHSFPITPRKGSTETDNPISDTSPGLHNPYMGWGTRAFSPHTHQPPMHSDFYDYAGNPKRPQFTTLLIKSRALFAYMCNGYIGKRAPRWKIERGCWRTHLCNTHFEDGGADFNAPRGPHISPRRWIYGRAKSDPHTHSLSSHTRTLTLV